MKIVQSIFFLVVISISLDSWAASVWIKIYPMHVKLLAGGVLLQSSEDIANIDQVPCATNKRALYLKNTDPQFDRKFSLAMSAQAQGKAIQVLNQPDTEDACTTVSAHGSVAMPFHYYWNLIGN